MDNNRIRRFRSSMAARLEDEAIDAVVDLRARRRCHYDRAGMSPAEVAAHLLADTGDLPGWDDGIGYDEGDWAS